MEGTDMNQHEAVELARDICSCVTDTINENLGEFLTARMNGEARSVEIWVSGEIVAAQPWVCIAPNVKSYLAMVLHRAEVIYAARVG